MTKTIPTERILADNLNRLMAERWALDSNPKLSAVTKLSTSTISRLRNAAAACTLDTLDLLAEAFEIWPWQLLVPNLDPANFPVLRTLSAEEAMMYERLRSVIIEKESDFGKLDMPPDAH